VSDSEYAGPSGSACRVPAHNLKTVAFPDCASKCAFVEIMGVGECESACPWKFGNPVDGEKLRQNRRVGVTALRPAGFVLSSGAPDLVRRATHKTLRGSCAKSYAQDGAAKCAILPTSFPPFPPSCQSCQENFLEVQGI